MTMFTLLAPTTRAALLADLEKLWQCFDEVVGTLGPEGWSGRHGQHWTFPNVPYHLTTFDREVIATAIKRGLNVQTLEQSLRTEAEQDAWKEITFTQHPPATTPDMHNAPFRVALAQVAPVFLDRTATQEKACELMVDAGHIGARLIVFPAAFIPGYPARIWSIPPGEEPLLNELYRHLLANAVSIPSETTDRLFRIT